MREGITGVIGVKQSEMLGRGVMGRMESLGGLGVGVGTAMKERVI